MEGRKALKLIYFAVLIISSVLPQSFFVRWFSMIMLSASLVFLLMMRMNKAASLVPDPNSFYDFTNETHVGSLARTSDIIRRASLGHSFARELVADKILEILVRNFSIVSKKEIRRNPDRYLPKGALLYLLEGEEFDRSEYLSILESALKEIDVRGN